MISALSRVLPADPAYRRSLVGVYALLAAMNIGAWLWALIAFAGEPVLMGVGVVVYGLGLRHAVDADHIAAIDNVTRKLMQKGERSASVGLWFALGHSAVIFLATAIVVVAAGSLTRLEGYREIGGLVSTAASAVFLLIVAITNICILLTIIRTMRSVRSGRQPQTAELDLLFSGNGLLSRIFRPLFRLVDRPWQMGLLGFVFGLSFDTASEVALFGISATQVSHGAGFGAALVYPALFAAGMSLLDTTDGVMMVGAYHWAVADPLQKLYYNLTITLMSIAVALFIGGIEVCTLIVRWFGISGPFAHGTASLTDNFNHLGIAIVMLFGLAWLLSAVTFRLIVRRSPPLHGAA